MAGPSPAPLPSLGTLFNDFVAGTGGGMAAPLPCLASLFAPPTAILTAISASFTMAGKSANLRANRKLVAQQGTFTWTGKNATLTPSTLGGVEAPAPLPCFVSLLISDPAHKFLPAQSGSFAMVGNAAILNKGNTLFAQPGAFVWDVAPSESDVVIDCARGTFTMTGNAAALMAGRPSLVALTGHFNMVGNPAALTAQTPNNKVLSTVPAVFTMTGKPAGEIIGRRLTATPGNFVWTGNQATLSYIPIFIPPPPPPPLEVSPSIGVYGGAPRSRTHYRGGGQSGSAWAELELEREKERAEKRERELRAQIRALRAEVKQSNTPPPAAPPPAPRSLTPPAFRQVDPDVHQHNAAFISQLLDEL